jgi:thiaminase (transcriptional activator TenA)
MWGFCEIGLMLAKQGMPADSRYVKWIRMYSAAEFVELTEWTRDLLDRLATGLPQEELQRIEEAFITSSRFEYAFWDMAHRLERWPV